MKENLKYSKGHPYLDAYRHWHKNSNSAPRKAYGIDVDYVMASFKDDGIVAVVDFKRPGGGVSRTESIVYDHFNELGIPVYIVTFYADFHSKEFESNDNPHYDHHERISFTDDDIDLIVVEDWATNEKEKLKSAEEYWQWEKKVRGGTYG